MYIQILENNKAKILKQYKELGKWKGDIAADYGVSIEDMSTMLEQWELEIRNVL